MSKKEKLSKNIKEKLSKIINKRQSKIINKTQGETTRTGSIHGDSRVQEPLVEYKGGYERLLEEYIPDQAVGAELSVYLGKEDGHEEVQAALINLMDEWGCLIENSSKPIIASWSWKALFKFPALTSEERKRFLEMKDKIRIGLEQALLDKQRADIDSSLAAATAAVIASLKDQNEAVIQIGGILLVKNIVGGESNLIVKTLSSIELDELRSKPELLKSPNEILKKS